MNQKKEKPECLSIIQNNGNNQVQVLNQMIHKEKISWILSWRHWMTLFLSCCPHMPAWGWRRCGWADGALWLWVLHLECGKRWTKRGSVKTFPAKGRRSRMRKRTIQLDVYLMIKIKSTHWINQMNPSILLLLILPLIIKRNNQTSQPDQFQSSPEWMPTWKIEHTKELLWGSDTDQGLRMI